jgi:hypothetical protein
MSKIMGLGVCVGVMIAVLGALSDDGPFPIAGSKFHEAKEAAK